MRVNQMLESLLHALINVSTKLGLQIGVCLFLALVPEVWFFGLFCGFFESSRLIELLRDLKSMAVVWIRFANKGISPTRAAGDTQGLLALRANCPFANTCTSLLGRGFFDSRPKRTVRLDGPGI